MSVEFLAYRKIDGIPTLRDSDILDLYDRMESDGVSETVFQDGTIKSSKDFLETCVTGKNILYLVIVDNEPAIICWLNTLYGKSAQMHWSVFKNFWGRGSVELMKFAISNLIHMQNSNHNYLLDVLIGLVPITNRRAISFAIKCGANADTVVPHALYNIHTKESVDAVLIYYTRELSDNQLPLEGILKIHNKHSTPTLDRAVIVK